MMQKLLMAVCVSVMVAGISTLAHSHPEPTQAEINEWHAMQAAKAAYEKKKKEAEAEAWNEAHGIPNTPLDEEF